jgi:hypothetical protein
MITMGQTVIFAGQWTLTNVQSTSHALYLAKARPARFLFITFEQCMALPKTPHNVREAFYFTNLRLLMRIH